MTAGIVGRDEELDRIREFLASLEGGSASLILQGGPGIGKTVLWRAGLYAGAQRSMSVLAASAAEAEAKLAFASLCDLLDGPAERVLPALPAPQRRALHIALLREDTDGRPPDQRAIAVAFLNVLRRLAAAGPVLLAVDDCQWLDAPSAAVLAFVARRLRSERIGLFVAQRITEGNELPLGLERAVVVGRVDRLQVRPLSVGALHRMLRERLGIVFPRPLMRRLHDTAGGNPLFALELARAVEGRGGRLTADEPLPLPDSLRELVEHRITALPNETRDALAAAAALAQPTTALVAATTGSAHALDAARRAQIVELEDDRVRFVHSLLASAAYVSIDPAKRRELHLRLATAVDNTEERARHLALGTIGPDEEVAQTLEAAAFQARSRGAPQAAAELADQALRLTSSKGEDRLPLMLLAAASHFECGDTARAREQLEVAVAAARPGPQRAEALVRLATVHLMAGDVQLAGDLCRRAIAEAGDDPAAASHAEYVLAVTMFRMIEDLRAALRHHRAATKAAERAGDASLLAQSLVGQAWIEALRGRAHALDLVRRAVRLEEGGADALPADGTAALTADFHYGCLLSWADDLDGARERFTRARARVIEFGDEASLPSIYRMWSYAEWLAGNWQEAEALALDGHECALLTGQRSWEAFMLGTKALLAASRGREDDARRDAEAGLALADATGNRLAALLNLSSLGLLELSLGDHEATHRCLDQLTRQCHQSNLRDPTVARFLVDDIEALISLGRLDEAQTLLERFEEPARALDRASALASAARCRGLLAAARGDFADAAAALDLARREHDRVSQPFDRARTLLAAGQVGRRMKQKRAARESLDAARTVFDELGAALWAARARAELARIGGRAPATGELTPSERSVAELVAEGRSNKAIAAALFISPLTVEGHLKRIYAKLGIHSRVQLRHEHLGAEHTRS